MQQLFLSEINIYPVKSLKGISLSSANIEPRGLKYDRRWMLVDQNNRLVTQREYPKMAIITVNTGSDGLEITTDGKPSFFIPFKLKNTESLMVTVWRSTCKAFTVDKEVDNWFSDFLNTNCRLVYMPDDTKRPINPDYDPGNNIVSFADGYPFMLLTQASLNDLNEKLEISLPMNRFRPNLVISGTEAFDEDKWKQISIGDNLFEIVKPCERCSVTTIDQQTGVRDGKEPLKTLAQYRTINGKVLFGQNMVGPKKGTIHVGDKVEIIKLKSKQEN
jgi:uncharacterized protein YcbX